MKKINKNKAISNESEDNRATNAGHNWVHSGIMGMHPNFVSKLLFDEIIAINTKLNSLANEVRNKNKPKKRKARK